MKKIDTKKCFEGVETLEELKKMLHAYVLMYHPDKHRKDREEYTKIMAQINAEYDKAYQKVKFNHLGYDSKEHKYYKYTNKEEDPKESMFKDILNGLASIKGIKVELIGSWIWVSGNTKQVKDKLTELGLHYRGQKQAWEFHTGKFRRKSKPTKNMDDLRVKYGATEIKGKEEEQLVLA